MLAEQEKIVMDIHGVTMEVYGYLNTYVLNGKERLQQPNFFKDLEQLIYSCLSIAIELNINPLIRQHIPKNANKILFDEFCLRYQFDVDDFREIIYDLTSYKYLRDIITDVMDADTFMLWSLSKLGECSYILECFGDFRINQWMEDHVKSGRYIP